MSVKAKVNDRVWKNLQAHLKKAGRENAHVKVGILASTNAPVPGSTADLVTISTAHEFGTQTLPMRSHIRAGLQDAQDAHVQLLGKIAKGILSMTLTIDKGLGMLGLWGATTVRRYITDGKVTPPLQPSTIAAKGSSTPLVDTGQLVNAISWEVIG